MPKQNIEGFLTTGEAGHSLKLSGEYIRYLARRGKLDFVQTQLGKLIDPASVERFRETRKRRRAAIQ